MKKSWKRGRNIGNVKEFISIYELYIIFLQLNLPAPTLSKLLVINIKILDYKLDWNQLQIAQCHFSGNIICYDSRI